MPLLFQRFAYSQFCPCLGPELPPIQGYLQSWGCYARRDRLTIEPIPLSYSDLYDCLLKENLVGPDVPKPFLNPPPKLYNANETCKYHMATLGHSIERCILFKVHMQRLKDVGKIKFDDEEEHPIGPNVQTNPFPTHKVWN